jgi:hypothetical protein
LDSNSAYTLLLSVAMTTQDTEACAPNINPNPLPPDGDTCGALDPLKVAPVNETSYWVCGPPDSCSPWANIFDGAMALQFKCVDSEGYVGGSVDIGGGMFLEL